MFTPEHKCIAYPESTLVDQGNVKECCWFRSYVREAHIQKVREIDVNNKFRDLYDSAMQKILFYDEPFETFKYLIENGANIEVLFREMDPKEALGIGSINGMKATPSSDKCAEDGCKLVIDIWIWKLRHSIDNYFADEYFGRRSELNGNDRRKLRRKNAFLEYLMNIKETSDLLVKSACKC